MKVLIIRERNSEYDRIFTEHGIDFVYCENNEEQIVELGRDAEAIIFAPTRFTGELFDKLPALKIISRTGIGIDTVDMKAATEHGVAVCNCANYGTYDVAEHTVALMLTLSHSVQRYDRAIKQDNDWSFGQIPTAMRLSEKKLGIVGFGRISAWICRMMKGFGIDISVFDPCVNTQLARELGVTPVTLDELLKTSDIISVNAPLNDSTYRMIDSAAIEKMKDGVLIVNTSRGALIDEEALIKGLGSGKIGGAALDVFEKEPFAEDCKLRYMPNVVLTPHVAWHSAEAIRDLTVEATDNVIDYFEGRPLKNKLN